MSTNRLTLVELKEKSRDFQINFVQTLLPASAVGLISSVNDKGIPNLAIFNKSMILGSTPPLMGILFRPLDRRRDTYANIRTSGRAGWNAFTLEEATQAHATSEHFPQEVSEFDTTEFEPIWEPDNPLPWVKGSPIRIDLRYREEHLIQTNQTRMLIFEMKAFYIEATLMSQGGSLRHDLLPTAISTSPSGYASAPSTDIRVSQ